MRFVFLFVIGCAACNAIDGADQYKKAGGDAIPPGCDPSCITTSQVCLFDCTNTHNSCAASCSNPPKCSQCDTDYNTCQSDCVKACTQCGQDCTLALCTSDAGTTD